MEKLHGKFEDVTEYFRQAVDFLKEYKWIYQSANTHILVDDVPGHVPKQWVEIINFANWKRVENVSKGLEQPVEWPEQLVSFLARCRDLSLRIEVEKNIREGDRSNRKWNKINPKKIHEVINLAHLVGQSCQNTGVKYVVDIGAGLGYLDRELSDRYGLDVLGLEQDSHRVSTANQRSCHSENAAKAVFKELTLRSQDDLEGQINSMIDDWFRELNCQPSEAVPLCAVGLHACGDLSPTMLELFLKNRRREFHSLFLVSCCYHRMTISGDSERCNYFPISRTLEKCCQTDGGSQFFQGNHLPFFLRLAAQETTNRWLSESLEANDQLHNTFYRAILQLYADRDGVRLRKQHRKAVKKVKQRTQFEDYVDQAIVGFGLQGDARIHKQNLREIYQQHLHQLDNIETLIILQVLLQPVAEALLLIDRVVYLQENDARVTLEQVFDDRISPRCFATVAEKNA